MFITFFGQKNQGKDTIVEMLLSVLPQDDSWEIRSFAAPVKKIFSEVYGVSL